MKSLINELHERSLWQVLGMYLGTSWIVLQVVDVIGANFGLPDWVAPAALILLLVGLPIVLATAFVQKGLRPASPAPANQGTAPAAEGASAGSAPAGAHRLFTWKKALLGGAGAFTLLALVVGAWLVMRAAGIGPVGTLVASGQLEERALVVLADFEANDSDLSDAATEALRVDLSQSNVIRLADPTLIEDALQRMGRDPSEPLTPELATELAVREGAGAVVTGEINRAGSGHVFSAQVVSVADGSVLTSQRESAATDEDVIPAIDRLSKKLRERMGDSYRSIASGPPLQRVTTSSLEALKLYSRAANPNVDEVTLLEQAVALDSTFAMAWRALGIKYRNRRTNRARMIDAFTRAFEYRDHLTETERHKTASIYYTLVDFEPRLAAAEYEALLEEDPEDYGTVINLGVLASSMGNHEWSVRQSLRAIELRPEEEGPGYWNAITGLVNVGRLEEAEAMLDSAKKVWKTDNPARASIMVLAAQGKLDEGEANFRAYLEPGIPPGARAWLALRLGQFAAARGRLAEAEEETRVRLAFLAESEIETEYYETVVQAAWTDLVVRERPEAAVARLSRALEQYPLDDLEARDRPYLELAEVFAAAGSLATAKTLVEDMRADLEPSDLKRLRADLWRVQGEIALAEGRPDTAIEHFGRASEDYCHICPLPGLARAYEAAGQPDSAIAALTRYVETPFSDRFLPYSYPLGQALAPSHERLAELQEETGNLDEAAKHYARFVELWSDADEELQPRVRAAQDRLDMIVRARG
ncbi:MAG TPA: tetratricopeptide repeat protein [Gemmatimonadota bacterium]|nr:tetratricopeptide repeat protein [Gemmatimonadota bacterium]